MESSIYTEISIGREPRELLMQPVDDVKLHQFFFRCAKSLVLLEVAHVPMRASHRCCDR